jgi:hypothetical protein
VTEETKLNDIIERLSEFVTKEKFRGKGPLSVAVYVTDLARQKGLPLDPRTLVTEDSETQVAGISSANVQRILARHGEIRRLSKEAGRTSRGSVKKMQKYVALLNGFASEGRNVDLEEVERFWVEKVREFFAGKPFRIKLDASRSLRAVVRDVVAQAIDRQKDMPGTHFAGTVMQHLVGAKLDCALGPGKFEHNSYSTSDEQSGRAGDFHIEDVAVHVTTSPGEAVIERCKENLDDGLRPVIVTTQKGVTVAEALAGNIGLSERIDVFEIEQFIALNIYELGKFKANERRVAIEEIIERYNYVVEEVETDPSLRIEIRK